MPSPLLSHARLDVYRCAIEFLGFTTKLLDSLPRGNAPLAGPSEKKKHYAIARGSALGCSAILDCSLVLGLLEAEQADRGNVVLARVVSMLSKMAR